MRGDVMSAMPVEFNRLGIISESLGVIGSVLILLEGFTMAAFSVLSGRSDTIESAPSEAGVSIMSSC